MIAELVERTEALFVRACETGAHGHVGLPSEHRRDEIDHTLRRIGIVAVDHHGNIGVDLTEHLAHDMPFPGARDVMHERARFARPLGGAVGAAVVEDVNRSLGQRRPKIGHDLADGELLVQARNHDCDGGHRSSIPAGFENSAAKLSTASRDAPLSVAGGRVSRYTSGATFATSSTVVSPAATFIAPDTRSGFMPSL